MSPCRPDPLPSEAAEVTLSLRPPRVLWITLSPCRPVWPSSHFLLNSQSRPTPLCKLRSLFEHAVCQFLLNAF